MAITFGGKPLSAAARNDPASESAGDQQLVQSRMAIAGEEVLLAVRLVTLLLEAREEIATCMQDLAEIDVDVLNDPALQDHPQYPAALAHYTEACERERQAWIKAIEIGNNLAAAWDRLSVPDRNRYGLPRLVGADPEDRLMFHVWHTGNGIDRLVPMPEPWGIPTDLAHMVGRKPGEVQKHVVDALLRTAVAPF